MHRGRLLAVIVWAAIGAGPALASDAGSAPGPLELLDLDLEGLSEVEPRVDCSDGRPDQDCLSGRQGSDQVSQQCGGISVLFGAGSCSVHCGEGYYACGKCGWGGFAMCTCRSNYTCDPYRP
jgi:hypothetical protein